MVLNFGRSDRLRLGLVVILLLMAGLPVGSANAEVAVYKPKITLVGPTLNVNVAADRRAISPDIYGMNFYGTDPADFASLAAAIKLPVNRWGGNATTRYNWQTNSFNSGLDYFFEGNPNTGNDPALGQPSESDDFVSSNKAANIKSLVTVPTIGYVSKARTSHLCGFSVAKYGPQKATDAPFAPDCGNGLDTNGIPITNNDPLDTSIVVGPSFVQNWITHLKTTFGAANNGGVKIYELDNETSDWYETHRDVHPAPLTYNDLRDYTYLYGAAIKATDSSALTLGPSNFGWSVYADSRVPGDKAAHGGVGFSEWYLQQMKLYEQQNGVRILDYFDQHYYPAQDGVALAPTGDAATQQLRLRSTLSLWDPTYKDESWIGDPNQVNAPPIKVIPTFRDWVAANYPGTKLAITEYNFGGLESINGALTQADVLGIFGREQLDLATMWSPPSSTQPGAYAFRMYRNYDGAGSTFGDTWVQSVSADQGKLAIYGAQRGSDNALTLMVINKTGDDLTSTLALSGFNPQAIAKVYRYSEANLNAIVPQADQPVSASGFSATYPANSITLVALKKSVNLRVVKVATDSGDVQAADTLSHALDQALSDTEINFDLPVGVNTIMVTGTLPPVGPGVTIRATCNGGPTIILDGSGSDPQSVGDGLVLGGNNFIEGLKVTKFKGNQIKSTTGGNRLSCVVLSKT